MYGNEDEADIVKAGYLTKSPPGAAPPMSQWRRRWFVLRDSSRVYPLAQRHIRLEYYQSETDAKKLFDPKGVIDLKNCSRVSSVAKLKGHSYVFDICTKERTYHIAAETPTDKYDWMKTLNELLFQEVKEVQDLEKAEIQRKKSVSKSSATRQSSLSDVSTGDKKRPTSCFISPQDPKCQDDTNNIPRKIPQQGGNKKRPLPPTPDIPAGSVTLQSSSVTSSSQHHSSSTDSSPPPPLPKPRSKTSAESISSPAVPISTPSPTSVVASLPVDILIQTPSQHVAAYENVPNQRNDQPPPPIPKPRHRSSHEDHQSSYENMPRYLQSSAPEYEDINIDDCNNVCNTILDNPSKTTGNKIIFLDQDIYAAPDEDQDVYADVDQDVYTDPDVDVECGNTYLYDGGDNDMTASNYEVPINLKSPPPLISSGPRPGPPAPSPVPRSGPPAPRSGPLGPRPFIPINRSNPSLNDNPPVPPPRTRITKRSSIHSSLINLTDDGLYSELNDAEVGESGSDNDEHYGRLIRCVARERRFSDPEVIPISPRSHSSSPLFFSHKPKCSPPPVPPPYTGSNRPYYENTSSYSTGTTTGVRPSHTNGYT